MSNRIEDSIQKITTFEFKVFDNRHKDYMYDATPEQCCNYIWKNYYSSAVITRMVEFNIKTGAVKQIDSAFLKSIVNVYANGHDKDMNEVTLIQKNAAIESFKKKHKIE